MAFWNDWHDKLTGQESASERSREQHQRDEHTDKSKQEQTKLNDRGNQQAQDAGHGYDPAAISQHDNWSSWDHKTMHSMIEDVQPSRIAAKGTEWSEVAKNLADSFKQFHTEVTGAVKGGWTGDAATAAATAPDGMAKWGAAMASATDGTGTRIQQASTAADQAKTNMPKPVEFSWRRNLVNSAGGGFLGGLGGAALSGGTDAYEQHKEAQQAKQQAVNVMNRMYTQGYVDVDNTTPAFAAPEDDNGKVQPPKHHTEKIVEWPVKPPPDRTGGGDHNGTDTTGTDNGRDQQTGVPTDTGRTDPSQYDPTKDDQNNNLTTDPGRTDPSQFDPNGGHTGGHGGIDPRGAQSANAGGAGMGGMPMMGGGGMGGGGDSEYGGRGYGRGSSGMGASESGSGGRSGIGGSAAQEAMGGRGGAGRGGAGGMGGGRGGRKEEDSEHESPDYLVETDDVFGSGEMVAPPVIGGE